MTQKDLKADLKAKEIKAIEVVIKYFEEENPDHKGPFYITHRIREQEKVNNSFCISFFDDWSQIIDYITKKHIYKKIGFYGKVVSNTNLNMCGNGEMFYG